MSRSIYTRQPVCVRASNLISPNFLVVSLVFNLVQDKFPEVEVCAEVCEGQWECERLKKMECCKNPGHVDFIGIPDFRLEHVPKRYRNNQMLEYIKITADLVVRVNVKYVSPNRPEGYFHSDKRGQHVHTFASGWANHVYMKKKDSPCPCSACQSSVRPHSCWAGIVVVTALHGVFDSLEAAKTTCELFYDNEEVRGQGPKLEGIEVRYIDKERDWCEMLCVTHDMELTSKLEKMVAMRDKLAWELHDKYSYARPDDSGVDAVFVVSHPHGCSKQISWGTVTHREIVKPCRNYYSAHTCPGSSGGFVWCKGPWRNEENFYLARAHSSSRELGNFCVGHGWLFC